MRPVARADVKVGFACNNRCVFCAQGEKRSHGSIPVAQLLERLAAARAHAGGLVLTGGEPTIHKHIVQLVAAARKMGYDPIQIQTNGRMLAYPMMIEVLMRAGVSEFAPSLHGSRPDIHDALTRAPGSFAQTTDGIRSVVAIGATLVTNTVITKRNVHDIPAIVGHLGTIGVRHVQLAFVHPVGTAGERFDEVVPRLPDVVAPVRAARQVARSFGIRLVTEAIPYCFLEGMEELAVEQEIPATTVIDLDGRAADYTAWRAHEGKSHGDPCRECALLDRCEGPWREYPEVLGWSEFVPVRVARDLSGRTQ